jgi:hypothetical protein
MAIRKERVSRLHRGEPFLFSSYSRAGDDCIGVAGFAAGSVAHGAVAVLDSKDPQGPVLEVSTGAWGAFLGAVKAL